MIGNKSFFLVYYQCINVSSQHSWYKKRSQLFLNLKLDYREKQKTKHNIFFYFYLDLFCVRHTFVLSCVKKKNVKGGGGGGGGESEDLYTENWKREIITARWSCYNS